MKNEVQKITDTNRFSCILKGVIFSYIATFVLIFIYSIILAYTNVPDTTIPLVVTAITIFSSLWSATLFCKKVGTAGLLNGIIISGIYIGIIYVLGSTGQRGFALEKNSILMIISTILVGGMGGIIGVNLNRFQR